MTDIRVIRILYMEDDPGLSRLLQKNLQRRGYMVDIAPDGKEGIKMAGKTAYDVLLVDFNMPFYSGIDVIQRLSSKGSFPPTVMVTGYGNEEVAVEALKLGAADYIVKDMEMKYLDLLPMVIERVRFQQQLIRERNQMYDMMRESEERYRKLVEMSPDGIAVLVEGRCVFMNPAGARLLGASTPDQLIGRPVLDMVHPEFQKIAWQRYHLLGKQAERLPWIEEKYLRLDGKAIDVEVSGVPFTYQGKPAVQAIFRDITERKMVESRLKHMALYDSLTGLPNRTLFFDRMNQLLALAKRNGYVLALLFMDLDRFKSINDSLGHDIGDLLLKEVSARITACTRKADTVARMGGDEFISICGKIAAPGDAAVVARKIIAAISKPYQLRDHQCVIGASIGISLYPSDGEDEETLLKKADLAMYKVKERGAGGFAFYSEIEDNDVKK